MQCRRPTRSIALIVAVVATTLTALPTTPAQALPYEASTTGVRVVRVPGLAIGEALDVNEHGAVVGSGIRWDSAGQGAHAAFYWAGPGRGEAVQISPYYETDGVITDGAATALNDSSEVVGQHALPPSGIDGNRTFAWSPSSGRRTLAMPGSQPSFIRRQSATGIDSDGSIVGHFVSSGGLCSTGTDTCAFLGPADDLEALPAAGDGVANLAFDVSGGRVAGSGWTWRSGTGFTTLPGGFAWGAAINAAGAIAGQVRDPGTGGATWDDDPDAAYWPSPTTTRYRASPASAGTWRRKRPISTAAAREQAPTVSFALTETGASVTSHRIAATASSAVVDRVPANDTRTLDPDPVERTSDVVVSLELLTGGEGGTTQPREQLTYRATVRNDGPHDSLQTDLVIGFVGHYGSEVTVVDDGGCSTIDGSFPFVVQGLSCDLGPLPAGSFAFATIVFTVEVPLDEQDPWVVSADASTTSVDPDTTNDRTTSGLRVDATESDLLLLPGFLGDPPTATVVEREATWSFVYANGGPDTALAPVLTIEVTGDAEASVAGPDCTEEVPTSTTALFTCALQDLPFTVGGGTDTAVVTLASASTGPISVDAAISHPGTDPDATNDTRGWSLTVVPDPGGPATGPLLVDQTTLDPGQDLGIEGSGFDPGSPALATLFSDPTELGSDVADDTGTVVTAVTIPADTAPGSHRIVLSGIDPEGNGVILAATVCISTCADQDTDDDGLTDREEETLTGTDPSDADSDGDGLVDGLDPSWLDAHVAAVPASSFRWGWFGKLLLRVRVALLEVTLHQASWGDGLALLDEAASRADGCGARPDRDDLLRDCDAQTEFRTRLELLRRNVAEQVQPA